jgi:hypothetical protein
MVSDYSGKFIFMGKIRAALISSNFINKYVIRFSISKYNTSSLMSIIVNKSMMT